MHSKQNKTKQNKTDHQPNPAKNATVDPLNISFPFFPSLIPIPSPPLTSHSSILPSTRPLHRNRQGIQPNTVTDFPPGHIRILQPLNIRPDLIRARRGCILPRGTSQQARGAGEIDAEVSEVGARGVCEARGEGSGGDEGGVGLGVGEGAVGADVDLLAAGDDDVCWFGG